MQDYVFIIFSLTILGLGYFVNIIIVKNRKLNVQQSDLRQRRIRKFERERKIFKINAMLEKHEDERSRLAWDLQHGIVNLVLGAKLSFINIRENLVTSPEHTVHFDKSLNMLDNTVAHIDKIAQTLTPETLTRFGVFEAARDYCDYIRSATGIPIVYQVVGDTRRLRDTQGMHIYRIFQELVDNAAKHAYATEIIVQFAVSHSKISITVEDNGKGFDTKIINEKKGRGFADIEYRVGYLNGVFDIISTQGSGTSINIEVTVYPSVNFK